MYIGKRNQIVKRRKYPSERFIFFCAGIIIGSVLMVGVGAFLLVKSNDAVNIYVSGEKVLDVIGEQVEQQVQDEFPGFIREIKKEVPPLIEKYMHNFITIGNLEIGGYTVNLPPQFIKELENDLRNDVGDLVLEILAQLEREEFVQELSKGITEDLLRTLLADLNGQVIRISLTDRYTIPVVVWLY